MTMQDDLLQLAWIYLGVAALLITHFYIRNRAFDAGYWKGRAAGFELARRRAQIAKQVDEVFDYDKHN